MANRLASNSAGLFNHHFFMFHTQNEYKEQTKTFVQMRSNIKMGNTKEKNKKKKNSINGFVDFHTNHFGHVYLEQRGKCTTLSHGMHTKNVNYF